MTNTNAKTRGARGVMIVALLAAMVACAIMVWFRVAGRTTVEAPSLDPGAIIGKLHEVRRKRFEYHDKHRRERVQPADIATPATLDADSYALAVKARREGWGDAHAFAGSTREELVAWREQLRPRLLTRLTEGLAPPVGEPVVRSSTEGTGEYAIKEIALPFAGDVKVRALIGIPDHETGQRMPAIIALPGHMGSAEAVFGLDQDSRNDTRQLAFFYAYGHALARRGYVVLGPELCWCGMIETALHPPFEHDGRTDTVGIRIAAARACLDYLASRPDVDPARIGVMGLSQGGETALYVAALDTRVAAAAVSGCVLPTQKVVRSACRCALAPGFGKDYGIEVLIALVAPRPLVIENGENDITYPASEAMKVLPAGRFVYSLAVKPDDLIFQAHTGSHEYCGEKAFALFDRVLRGG